MISVTHINDIFPKWRKTPIADLLMVHNLGTHLREYEKPELLISACMDYRVTLRISANSAFVIRTPGANLVDSEFGLATAIALANIRAVALIGHTDCLMTKITDDAEKFIEGLSRGGWSCEEAERYYKQHVQAHALNDPARFVIDQCQRLRKRYAKVLFAPLIYSVEDGKLYQIAE